MGQTQFERSIRPRLLEVSKPARYIGDEPGMIRRDWDAAGFRFALAFPDLYEIGMSYHGREVLYQLLNAQPGILCERTFLPDLDMQRLMRREGVDLWALESKRPVREFDALGISFTYELAYPSGLALIDLAGIPLRAADRRDDDPLVVAGGQCMCNPEPVAPFFDVIVNGEGEETLLDIIDRLRASKGRPRSERLAQLARLDGCYVPSLFDPHYEYGVFCGTRPVAADLPLKVTRRYLQDFAEIKPPTNPVQSYIDLPSDKAYLEVMRGCPQGCRFCQAGYITRPARARTVELLARSAAELARNTGTDEVGLMSLSTLDHPQVFELIRAVKEAVPDGVGVGLPSLRADRMSADLAVLMRRPRETSLTVAVEAGSDSLRRAIRKGVTDDDVVYTFDKLMSAGWHKFKLYFMCGFAGEPAEAMDDIAALIGRIFAMAKERGHRRPRLTVSVSVLVPKPHTPFQWQAMERPELTKQKQHRLKDRLRRFGRSVEFKYHDSEQSVIETLLSRGGRNVAPAMELAFRRGQILPSDYFDWRAWLDVLAETGVDLKREVFTEMPKETPLPWDHISRHVGKRYLWREWEYYHSGDANPACHVECTNCGVGCAAPVFDPESRAVPAGLKEYFAKVAAQGEAEQRGLKPFSPVYPEELDVRALARDGA
ncbi:MAG TPA: TIGR03960 family B12-binding radical SAM protein, partial [Firmicutes bacterium]|nr:TIGR03960 family B12-binding radical SAM protein [Bacillota bacterium]